jgi:alpha-mannosidase
VRLSAFHVTQEGCALRLYESAGTPVEACVQLPTEFAEAVRTDFNGEPIAAVAELQGRTLRIPLRAWEIATVKLT